VNEIHKLNYKLYPGITSAEVFDPFSGDWIPWREGLVEELAKTQESLFEFTPNSFLRGEEELTSPG
jgi:hypothetical protein